MGSGGSERDDLAIEVARLRVALDELQGRPIPLDADTLRDVITASISDASALQPNLLVTAIRRLDRVDARLESIEATLGRLEVLPTAGPTNGKRGGRGVAAWERFAATCSAPAGRRRSRGHR